MPTLPEQKCRSRKNKQREKPLEISGMPGPGKDYYFNRCKIRKQSEIPWNHRHRWLLSSSFKKNTRLGRRNNPSRASTCHQFQGDLAPFPIFHSYGYWFSMSVLIIEEREEGRGGEAERQRVLGSERRKICFYSGCFNLPRVNYGLYPKSVAHTAQCSSSYPISFPSSFENGDEFTYGSDRPLPERIVSFEFFYFINKIIK